MEAGTTHSDTGINDYVATAAFHTGARQQAGNLTPNLNHYQPISSDTAVLQCVHTNAFLPDKDVLLKTAIATVTSASHVQAEANILFDEGAQKTFITEHLAEELELTNEATETIYLSSFGSTSNKLQQVGVATVHVIADNRQMITVRVLIVPTITTPNSNRLQHAVSALPYLRELKLAHPGTADSTFAISMLIGADFSWDLVEDHVIRGNGPTAVKSKIGYLLSGSVQAQNHRLTGHIFIIMVSHPPTDVSEAVMNDRPLTHLRSEYVTGLREYQNYGIE